MPFAIVVFLAAFWNNKGIKEFLSLKVVD